MGAEVRQLLIFDHRCEELTRTPLHLFPGAYVFIDHDPPYPGFEIGAWLELVE
nr:MULTISPECIES: hypothetical protein [unclassified Streptomyces]